MYSVIVCPPRFLWETMAYKSESGSLHKVRRGGKEGGREGGRRREGGREGEGRREREGGRREGGGGGREHEKSQQSLDCYSSHQQGICITCLAVYETNCLAHCLRHSVSLHTIPAE